MNGDDGLSLSPRNRVIIFGRGHRAKCLPLLWERVAEKIKKHDSGLELTLTCAERKEKISTDFLIVAIGRKPCLNFMSAETKRNFG